MSVSVSCASGEHDVPELLVSPPWLARKRTRPRVVDVATVRRPVALRWLPGERQAWADIRLEDLAGVVDWQGEIDRAAVEPDFSLIALISGSPDGIARSALPLLDKAAMNDRFGLHIGYLASALPHDARNDPHRKLLGRFGAEALGFVLDSAISQDWYGAALLMPMVGSDITDRMVGWLERDEQLAAAAGEWFARHTEAALPDLIPAAIGKGVKVRRLAESLLWRFDSAGQRELIRAAAACYGSEAAAAIDALLDRDPLSRLPTRIPKAPGWLDVSLLPRIRLRDSAQVLPEAAVEHLISMLMMCGPDEDYAGVPVVARQLDPVSLGEFVWAVYRTWQAAKYPAKRNMWAMRALGLAGNDETAARLRVIAERDRAVTRSLAALDMLVLLGTRNAHMHIQLARENTGWPEVRRRADEIIRELARDLGITPVEFADRAVPDLGLSARGTRTVDYGSRRFLIDLDEQLKPVVREENGEIGASLPKPGKGDDPSALSAYAEYGSFKKALQAAIADQSTRLESAMVAQRRWTVASQRRLFIEHPLLRQLARRLVWASFDTVGAVTGTFRIDMDGTLADLADDLLELPDEVQVGIAHPLHLGGALVAWAGVFADYGIAQPFAQLDRPSFAPGDPEVAAGLEKYRGAVVSTGTVLGLNRFGWAKGYGAEGSVVRFTRALAARHEVRLYISPGIDGRNPLGLTEQTLRDVVLPEGLALADLPPIVVSELLRELETLR
ncbi:DUF4132 domain-containing protein [Nocardia sp. NBC_01503]|uniref:DUF4132 domain-containing protein n=1 Tax=Nocardia sp. NBC_01503 TaxID=2975997 RepID=UPI002E7B6B54|nr:DUF4132 domain-containing protein [Nocardia sp. NBC_01503]WTL29394.1 DUF4132 domain-containing protein [Nocardia sp. NBC_01503]